MPAIVDVIQRINAHTPTRGRRIDETTITHINAHVRITPPQCIEKYQITRLQLAARHRLAELRNLIGIVWQPGICGGCKHIFDQAAAIKTTHRPGPAIVVLGIQKTERRQNDFCALGWTDVSALGNTRAPTLRARTRRQQRCCSERHTKPRHLRWDKSNHAYNQTIQKGYPAVARPTMKTTARPFKSLLLLAGCLSLMALSTVQAHTAFITTR